VLKLPVILQVNSIAKFSQSSIAIKIGRKNLITSSEFIWHGAEQRGPTLSKEGLDQRGLRFQQPPSHLSLTIAWSPLPGSSIAVDERTARCRATQFVDVLQWILMMSAGRPAAAAAAAAAVGQPASAKAACQCQRLQSVASCVRASITTWLALASGCCFGDFYVFLCMSIDICL